MMGTTKNGRQMPNISTDKHVQKTEKMLPSNIYKLHQDFQVQLICSYWKYKLQP